MSEKPRVLLIGPHPDDVFISCAGYVIKHINDYVFDILCMTSKEIKPSSDVRIQEEKTAWSAVTNAVGGVISLSFFEDGVDTQLFKVQDKLISYIERMFDSHSYNYIFTPYMHDTHQDHRTVSEATLSASRYQKNVIFYETPSTLDFYPNLYVDMCQRHVDYKLSISKEYRSVQIFGDKKNYQHSLNDYIYAKLLSNGAKSRVCKYAEGFCVHKLVL